VIWQVLDGHADLIGTQVHWDIKQVMSELQSSSRLRVGLQCLAKSGLLVLNLKFRSPNEHDIDEL
jgi:hypothetical protein